MSLAQCETRTQFETCNRIPSHEYLMLSAVYTMYISFFFALCRSMYISLFSFFCGWCCHRILQNSLIHVGPDAMEKKNHFIRDGFFCVSTRKCFKCYFTQINDFQLDTASSEAIFVQNKEEEKKNIYLCVCVSMSMHNKLQ